MTRKRNADAEEDVVRGLIRSMRSRGRRTLKEWSSTEWSPLYVERIGEQAWQIARTPKAEVKDSLAWFHVDDIDPKTLPLVKALVGWLDEQAAMARVATFVAKELEERDARNPETSKAGGKGKAAAVLSARHEAGLPKLDELDDLIRGCHARREPMRVKVWIDEYRLGRTAIYERIKRVIGTPPD